MSIEETLLQKVKQNRDDMIKLMEEFKLLKKLITGNGDVGLSEQVRNNTKFRRSIVKLAWLSIVIGGSQTVALIALLIHLLK